MKSLTDSLITNMEQKPAATAFTFLPDGEGREENITYAELYKKVTDTASVIAGSERVVLLFDSGLEFIYAMWGCLMAEVTAVPVNPPYNAKTLEKLFSVLQEVKPDLVLTSYEIYDKLALLPDDIKQLLKSYKTVITDQIVTGKTFTYKPVKDDTPAIIQYTSGSTGDSRGVVLTHGNLIENIRMLSCLLDIIAEPGKAEVFMCWLPLYHDMGLMSGVLLPVAAGVHTVIMSPLHFLQKPYRWLKAITDYQVTYSGAPNFAYELCVRKLKDEQLAQLDLSSWKVALNGAEPVHYETVEKFSEKFGRCGFRKGSMYPAYGLAEATVFVTGGIPQQEPFFITADKKGIEQNEIIIREVQDENILTLVSSGIQWREEKVCIVEDGKVLPENRIGEIWVSGKNVGTGYWNNPDETEKIFNNYLTGYPGEKFMRTGDLGFLHNKNLYVTGRIKELIIIRGQNYYPHQLEKVAAKAHPAIKAGKTCAFSINHGNEEKLVILAEIPETVTSGQKEIIEAIKKAIAENFGLTVKAELVKPGVISKTSSGKIQRGLVRQRWLNTGGSQ